MGGSREASPDWLRAFQAPTRSITTLSSDSDLSGDKSPAKDNSTDFNKDMKLRTSNTLEADEEEDKKICNIASKSPNKKATKKLVGGVTPAKRKRTVELENGGIEDAENVKSEKYLDKSTETSASAPNPSVFELSSDSESKSDATVRKKKKKIDAEESAPRSTLKGKSPNKRMKQEDVQLSEKRKTDKPVNIEGNNDNTEVAEGIKSEKQTEPAVNSSTLPLVLPEKVHRSKALVECEGESIDLSGDMGAVGRVIISETPSKESEMFLDLKGTIYKTTIVPSRTFCVVSIGQSEAKTLESDTLLNTRHHPSIVMRWPVDDRVLRYVHEAGLYGIHRVGQIPLDRGMITALVERWRPETHTFHLSVGEATITLRDVAILTDLPVSGRAVTGPSPSHTRERIHRMFGVLPPDGAMIGSSVKATWLHNTFAHLPGPDAEDAALERYARIYCWVLISGYLFVDKSGNDMQGILLELFDQDWDDIASYSWASAALAFLYRHLCRAASIKRGKPASDIAGPLVILQLWIWEHITFCTPAISTRRRRGEDGQPVLLHVEPEDPAEDEPYGSRWLVPRLTHLNTSRGVHVFRDLLDRMISVQMIWDPYPAYRGDEDEWRVRTPMIFFDVVEYHYPERVMRQYGLRQTRPGPPEDHTQLHEVDRRGKATVNWAAYHRRYIDGWDGREDYVVHGDEIGEPMDFYDDYLIWYRGITRRFISRGYIPDRPLPLNYMPSGVPLHVLTQQMLSIRDYMHSQRHVCHEQSIEVVRRCDSVMVGLGYEHMLQPLPQDDAPCSSTQADAQGTSNDHQSPYTLSVRQTAPGTSQGECSYVSPVHPTNVRLYQESDSEGTPLVYPSLDTIYEGDTPTADS